jgi:hypothetical protein
VCDIAPLIVLSVQCDYASSIPWRGTRGIENRWIFDPTTCFDPATVLDFKPLNCWLEIIRAISMSLGLRPNGRTDPRFGE